jgi:hypothetical protein
MVVSNCHGTVAGQFQSGRNNRTYFIGKVI